MFSCGYAKVMSVSLWGFVVHFVIFNIIQELGFVKFSKSKFCKQKNSAKIWLDLRMAQFKFTKFYEFLFLIVLIILLIFKYMYLSISTFLKYIKLFNVATILNKKNCNWTAKVFRWNELQIYLHIYTNSQSILLF